MTEEQREAKTEWDEAYNGFLPSPAKLQEEVDDYRGGYVRVFRQRVKVMRRFNFMPAYFPPFADMWAMMLLGMALFKTGVLRVRARRGSTWAWRQPATPSACR